MKQKLMFREDSTFTIVQFTDIHWRNGDEKDAMTRALMARVLDAEQPNLVVFTGDVVATYACDDPIQSFRDAVSEVESRRIPWAVTFGNHDSERGITRRELMDFVSSYEQCLTERGPVETHGFGNCVVGIHDRLGRTASRLYFFDSGNRAPLLVGGYDWIRKNQVEWYVRQSRAFTALNGGIPVPSLAFFHIPLPEYNEVWERETCYGNKFEEVCCPKVNSGLFSAMVEMGDVIGTFVGHDHVNDYWGELSGIRLCYGRATGYNEYGRDGFARGARVIRLKEGEREFDSWIRLDDGTVIVNQPPHAPERRL